MIPPPIISQKVRILPSPSLNVMADVKAVFTAPFTLSPEDVFWGNLSGCLEAIDVGTTTALNFAHVNWTKENC